MDARLAAAACALALPLAAAGCLEDVGTQGLGPVAELRMDGDQAWAGRPVTFDARSSQGTDDEPVAVWRFDFGDGSQAEVRSLDEARLDHEYDEPGRYVVTLTVQTEGDGGGKGEGGETDTDTLTLAVGERVQVTGVVAHDPAGLDSVDNASVELVVRDGATAFAVDLDVDASGLNGTRVRATVVDPAGNTLDEVELDLASGESGRIAFDGRLARDGRHELRLEALQGSAQVQGEVQVLYGQAA